MDPKLRIVKRLPLEGLWDKNGQDLNLHAARELGGDDIRDLLRGGRPVPFVVVKVGSPPRWIHGEQRFDFWKNELRPHLAVPSAHGHRLEDFPDEYFYWATEWHDGADAPYCIVCSWNH